MEEFKGAKGTFFVENYNGFCKWDFPNYGVRFISEDSSQLNPFYYAIVFGWTKEEANANAKLIAAEPELLKLAQTIVSQLDDQGGPKTIFEIGIYNESKSILEKVL